MSQRIQVNSGPDWNLQAAVSGATSRISENGYLHVYYRIEAVLVSTHVFPGLSGTHGAGRACFLSATSIPIWEMALSGCPFRLCRYVLNVWTLPHIFAAHYGLMRIAEM